jgi:hypothetical protein
MMVTPPPQAARSFESPTTPLSFSQKYTVFSKLFRVCDDLHTHTAMTGPNHIFWDQLPDDLAEDLLARAAAGEAIFCEHLEQLMAA